jgi:ABC-type lipoprotein export system ATPase subunit
MNLFSGLNKQGRTIILVTHDLSLIKYANKVIRLKDGKIDKTPGQGNHAKAYKSKTRGR